MLQVVLAELPGDRDYEVKRVEGDNPYPNKTEASIGTYVWSSGVHPRSKVFTQENQFSCNENFERSNGEHDEESSSLVFKVCGASHLH